MTFSFKQIGRKTGEHNTTCLKVEHFQLNIFEANGLKKKQFLTIIIWYLFSNHDELILLGLSCWVGWVPKRFPPSPESCLGSIGWTSDLNGEEWWEFMQPAWHEFVQAHTVCVSDPFWTIWLSNDKPTKLDYRWIIDGLCDSEQTFDKQLLLTLRLTTGNVYITRVGKFIRPHQPRKSCVKFNLNQHFQKQGFWSCDCNLTLKSNQKDHVAPWKISKTKGTLYLNDISAWRSSDIINMLILLDWSTFHIFLQVKKWSKLHNSHGAGF